MPDARHTASQTTTAPLRVLLIEDSEEDTFLLNRHFERAGFRPFVRRVETAEAMRHELTQPDAAWDVVLADYNLPTFSAPAALKLLKRLGQDLPFIMMSGAVSEETAVDAMRAGAHDYVSKQNLARLIPAIEREMREASARRLRRDAEAALRVSEERFRRLIRAMPVGLMIAEPTGVVQYANNSVERLLGYSEDELRTASVTMAGIFEGGGGAFLSRLAGASAAERMKPFEALCRARDGAQVPVLLALAALASEDAPESASAPEQIAVFFIDLSEQKRSEEVMRRTEKLAATGRLAASIAHEINNPLEAVTNCLYLIGSSSLDGKAREYLQMAQQELDRVTHITTQTLRFYRQSTKPLESDINELLDTVIALYEPRMRSFSIAIQRRYGAIPPVWAYDGEIRQVLANLVGNAVDAMHRNGGRLLLRTASGRDPKSGTEGIYVTVADTGSGMTAATRTRIFEAFFSTKGITGTGLGLWVSQTILEKHGGRAFVRSRVPSDAGAPGGTVFRIFLPLRSNSMEAAHTAL